MKTSDNPIVLEQTFNRSLDLVWESITDIEQMRKWYFENIPEFKLEIGFKTQFNIESGERNFLHKWIITKIQPLKLIEYSWEYKGYSGKSKSAFELFEEHNLTKLRVTIEILEDFQEDIPEFQRESCIAGWDYFIKQNLNNHLAEN